MISHAKEGLASMLQMELPSVRVRYNSVGVTEDGIRTPSTRETTGRLAICGEEVYVEIWAASQWWVERFTWEQVLRHLNEPFSSLLYFQEVIEYEI